MSKIIDDLEYAGTIPALDAAAAIKRMRRALSAGRGYVECCCEPDGKDGASAALKQIDAALAE